jgi:response regulator RpfG family c-di-GMP phosphodiesterase
MSTATPPEPALPRVLFIDDEPNVLAGMQRMLRREYEVVVSDSPAAGLRVLENEGPFAVVVSDMRMPGMDGASLLGLARARAPETSRILLTGHAELEAAIAAVNRGKVLRFLTKPCDPEQLRGALAAAVEQHRLVTSERQLLDQTLRGSVQALTEILALAHPEAFGRARRLRELVQRLSEHARQSCGWDVEIAAMLSHIGAIALTAPTAGRLYRGEALSEVELAQVARLPLLAERILANIPRLEQVRAILRHQSTDFAAPATARGEPTGAELPWGARALRLLVDWDQLEARGLAPELALSELRSRPGRYDPSALAALECIVGERSKRYMRRSVMLTELLVGSVIDQDICTRDGKLLVARGQEVSENLLERLHNYQRQVGIVQPIRVLSAVASGPLAA